MDDLPNLQELKKEESIFDSLQKNALETIRELSGQLWTDHAPHDPGITTLDILNYALSELDYQMSFPLEQYLTGSDNRFNPEDYGLFSPERVSGMAPVTPKDYRDHFLDHLDKKKKKELIDLKKYKETIVFYESPHRIKKTLNLMLDILGDRNIALCREITKKHEEIIRGHISEIISIVEELKGEMVIVVEGSQEVEEEITFETTIKEDVDMYIEKGMSTKDAIKEVAKQRNLNKNSVYQEYHSK